MDRNVRLTALANVVKDLLDLTVANVLMRTRLLAQAIMTFSTWITQHAWHIASLILSNAKRHFLDLMTSFAIRRGKIVKQDAI